jgi:hypothetical protein
MYVIADDPAGPVKLGISVDPDQRLRQLQTGHAAPLRVFHREPVDAERVKLFERLLHRDNHHHRLRGEWFNLDVARAIAYVQFTIIQYDLVPLDELRRKFPPPRCRTKIHKNG